MDKSSTIGVVVEHDHNGIKPVTYEVLNAARNFPGLVSAYYFSNDGEANLESLIQGGADEVRVFVHPDFVHYTHETYTAALINEIKKSQPAIILLSASNNGKELAAAVATHLEVG